MRQWGAVKACICGPKRHPYLAELRVVVERETFALLLSGVDLTDGDRGEG